MNCFRENLQVTYIANLSAADILFHIGFHHDGFTTLACPICNGVFSAFASGRSCSVIFGHTVAFERGIHLGLPSRAPRAFTFDFTISADTNPITFRAFAKPLSQIFLNVFFLTLKFLQRWASLCVSSWTYL